MNKPKEDSELISPKSKVKVDPLKSDLTEATDKDLRPKTNGAAKAEDKPKSKRGRPSKEEVERKKIEEAQLQAQKEGELFQLKYGVAIAQTADMLNTVFNGIIGERLPEWKLTPDEVKALANVTPPYVEAMGWDLNLGPKATFYVTVTMVFFPRVMDTIQKFMANKSKEQIKESINPLNWLRKKAA